MQFGQLVVINHAMATLNNNKSKTLFEVMGHLTYSTAYYINTFTNLSLLSVEIYSASAK